MVLDFFVDLMFILWESLRKSSTIFSIDCDILEATWSRTPLEAHACGDHGHGYAGPKTAFLVDLAGISETVSELLPRFYEFVDGT